MTSLTPGIHHLKKRINIHAPVEVCYQAWLDSPRFPEIAGRVLGVQHSQKVVPAITAAEEILANPLLANQAIIPARLIKHWLFSGPGGKLYEIENTSTLEIPNLFYCTISTDPNDLSIQSSILFSPDEMNQQTLLEWQVSFWVSAQNGSMTQLASDILETDDCLMEDCLQDFKSYIESR